MVKGSYQSNKLELVETGDAATGTPSESVLSVQSDNIRQQVLAFERWKVLGYFFPFMKGILYPLFKISLIALSSELLREVLKNTLDVDLFEQIDEELYGSVRDSPITSIYLMESLSFYQILGVVSLYILIIAIVQPIHIGLKKNYNCYMEVKRLQMILYDKFILQPNTVDVKEAMELEFTNMNSIQKYWSESKYNMIDDCTSAIWCLILIFTLSWDLGIIIIGGTTVIMLGTRIAWNKLSTPWSQQREIKMAKASARLMDLVACKDVVLSHTMEKKERLKLQQAVYSDKEELRHLFWAEAISKFIEYATFTFIMPSLFIYVKEIDLTMERVFQLLLIVVIQDEMVRAYLAFAETTQIMEEGNRAKQTFATVLHVDEDILFPSDFAVVKSFFCRIFPRNSEEKENKELESSASFININCPGKFSLQNASMGYWRHDGSFNDVLKDINLDLAVGSHYAIMGETGAGKSTLFKALCGLIPMQKGKFLVDGKEVNTTWQSWRKQLGVVSQDSVLLNRTLRENLAYGIGSSTNITDEDIYRALEKVNLKKIVDKLPQGLDTEVRENGNEFSGGQRQRIQIARLLLSDSPIVLLDEMTSALDPETSMIILEVLDYFLKGKTLIMVTHDLQTLTLADKILDMQIGKPIVTKVIGENKHESAKRLSSLVTDYE